MMFNDKYLKHIKDKIKVKRGNREFVIFLM